MLVNQCMCKTTILASPEISLTKAAQKMRDGNFGMLPVSENDRLVGVITDRDIAVRAIAEAKDSNKTKVREVMTPKVLYCYEDQTVNEVAANMGTLQVRRLPVLNRKKRLVGIVSLADLAIAAADQAQLALAGISQPPHQTLEIVA